MLGGDLRREWRSAIAVVCGGDERVRSLGSGLRVVESRLWLGPEAEWGLREEDEGGPVEDGRCSSSGRIPRQGGGVVERVGMAK